MRLARLWFAEVDLPTVPNNRTPHQFRQTWYEIAARLERRNSCADFSIARSIPR
jgi:integrase